MAKINQMLKKNIKLIVFFIDILLPVLLFYALESGSDVLSYLIFVIVGIARMAFVIYS